MEAVAPTPPQTIHPAAPGGRPGGGFNLMYGDIFEEKTPPGPDPIAIRGGARREYHPLLYEENRGSRVRAREYFVASEIISEPHG